jgi:general secretion pathway protein F
MPRFAYRALSAAGETVRGETDAADADAAIAWLKSEGLLPIEAVERRDAAWRWGAGRRVPVAELARLFALLARLLRAGVVLDRALGMLTEATPGRAARALLAAARARMRGGARLSEALGDRAAEIGPMALAMIRAGEESGALAEVLARIAAHMARVAAIRQRVISASIYPAILLAAATVTIGLFLGIALPQFQAMFAEAGARPAGAAGWVLAGASWLADAWWWLLAGFAALLLGARLASGHPGARAMRDGLVLRLPLIGGVVRRFEAGRFLRGLAILLGNGVPAARAAELAAATVENRAMGLALAELAAALRAGDGVAATLARSGALPGMAAQLVRVGEETGRLAEMLGEAAELMDAEVERLLERLLAALVPAITLVLGLVVALIVAAVITAVVGVNALLG